MPGRFSAPEHALLRSVPGVGEGLVLRLERCGIHSLAELARFDTVALTARLALANCSHCWETSPKARRLANAIIGLAQRHAAAT
ncbi:helix-hairpin-helix domain-containing protein [Herbaspirillum sp. LeCh32-8]|uniref:helix-hairpin-helix domain-containing protein n=1 Tax=Herbaspirillum sp. LeCh32-8 TaxID=2821356 RepID=UPI001AE28BB4|nr:helix-hairpin-helix domain-containing protein [Herbaspirillum sp. LeCh32-8]MBP0600063.1 helix-hairpin-helix domain-containing protein [Herbaspirillum sp. LeCh32-8]